MSVAEQAPDTHVTAPASAPELHLMTAVDRRADVESKQIVISDVLKNIGCDGLLVLKEENFAWLTGGGISRGIVDMDSMPALYFNGDARWLLCANVDTQRIFDEEIDGLGFQLKEWPWHLGRAQLLAALSEDRSMACDEPLAGCKPVGDLLHKLRIVFTDYEKACYRALGQIVSHALEATGRTLVQGQTEREAAGQLCHRLIHRGALPQVVSVYADGRSRLYRQAGFTNATIQNYGVLTVAARKYGLSARASRTVVFGQPDVVLRKEHDSACKVCANYVASSWPDSVPRQILTSGQRIYQIAGAEHEWTLCPQGHLTGRAIHELALTPQVEDLLQNNSAVTWHASVGAAVSCDTFLINEDGPRALTIPEHWPLKRIRIQGAEFVRPDLLVRQ